VAEKSLSSSIQAHDTELGAISVNPEGTLIASASQKGTIIRIFSADGGEKLQELRRGSDSAIISSIVFHPTLHLIAVTSDKSSIHLFEIKKSIEKCIELKQYGFTQGDKEKGSDGANKKSSLSFLKFASNFFEADLCFAKIKVEEKIKTIAFDEKNNSLTVMSTDRVLYFFKIPSETIRYIGEAEIRTF
jgi:WD40 repeat protein